jgi:hypothetical protein
MLLLDGCYSSVPPCQVLPSFYLERTSWLFVIGLRPTSLSVNIQLWYMWISNCSKNYITLFVFCFDWTHSQTLLLFLSGIVVIISRSSSRNFFSLLQLVELTFCTIFHSQRTHSFNFVGALLSSFWLFDWTFFGFCREHFLSRLKSAYSQLNNNITEYAS